MVDDEADTEEVRGHDADRLKFFTDAVVAIALTLLILPLLESVSEAGTQGLTTHQFVRDHSDQLISFLISFIVIAGFWSGHERMFAHIGAWTGHLVSLNFLWMLTIVFLPVATAMIGSLPTDALQVILYIGTMWANSLLMLAMAVLARRHRSVWRHGRRPGTAGVSASISLVILFGVALAIALSLPGRSHYYAMFVLFLTGPLQALVDRWLRAHDRAG